jgi:Glycosyltransferase family 92
LISGWTKSTNMKMSYLLSCPIDSDGELPKSVSLTTLRCADVTNRLDIIDNRPPNGVKQKFGICTKQLNYEGREFIVKFIEWIHLLQLMGVSKVHMTVIEVHEEMVQFLEYFEKLGFIEWKRYKDPKDIGDNKLFSSQHRFLQMLVENDCFYRTKDLYEHIVLIDPDEIIMPLNEADLTWEDVWNRLNLSRNDVDSVSFQDVYFPVTPDLPWPDIPTYDYMLQHVKRTIPNVNPNELQSKSFFQPDNVIVVYNHHAMFCLNSANNSCKIVEAPVSIAQLNHYRNEMKTKVKANVKDRVIWKYKNELINAVEETLNHFNFQPDI